jgi:ATP synthase subunit 6
MTFFSPLEQFEIRALLPIHIGRFYFSFTNSSIFIAAAVGIFLLVCLCATKNGGRLVPTPLQSLLEIQYEFVVSIVSGQVGKEGKIYFPFVFTLFTFVLLSNLIGLVPYTFTTTSHIMVTFGLSFSIVIGVTVIGFQTHGVRFFSFLLPQGAPLLLAPLLVPIELISYLFRAVSLGVRLFANIITGHTLVKILSGFALKALAIGGILKLAALVPLLVVFALIFLDFGVACLQAYVFTILTCIYLHDAIHLH